MRSVCEKKLDFLSFIVLWNIQQGFETPKVHRTLANFLMESWVLGREKALLLAFRGCGKSTIVGLFCAWILYQNPNLRILVLSAESNLAKCMVRTVKRIIENHPLLTALKPKKIEQWAGDCFTVNRSLALREASMQAEGILGNITGARADIIICDDVEVPNTAGTALKRSNLRTRLQEVDYILVPNGLQLYVGTPHTFFSIYKQHQDGKERPFLQGFTRLEIPLVNKDGKSAWEERFKAKDIVILKQRHGIYTFNMQMQLQCIQQKDSCFNPSTVPVYDERLCLNYGNGEIRLNIGAVRMLSCSTVWDPAYGTDTGDASVIATVFTGEDGKYYLHALHKITVDEKATMDPARQQCEYVARFMRTFHIPSIHLETNGLGKFLPRLLKNILVQNRIGASVVEFHSNTPKNIRIVESFAAILEARHLLVNTAVLKRGFLEQMSDFTFVSRHNRDDMLDAVARCLSFEPVRLKTIDIPPAPTGWTRAGKLIINNGEFDI